MSGMQAKAQTLKYIHRCQPRVNRATWMATKGRSDRKCLYIRTKFHENLSVDPECMQGTYFHLPVSII